MTLIKPAYILLDTKINDPIAFEDYKAAAKPIAEKFGGKYLTRGGEMDVIQKDLWALQFRHCSYFIYGNIVAIFANIKINSWYYIIQYHCFYILMDNWYLCHN